ncbi:basic proline-rich protein-like [Leopardus geoffroyi]|uniref:basic proline-rich protein-like n=1 Tax=Leopardus geoffroyi TaxID=46844 RepID=UPI001E262AD3|nr:basic proline-rich protein-like [Leopardus geoffroyi]
MPPSPPPLSSPCRSPPSSSTQSRPGERDPPPARPAARLRGAGSRPPARSHPPARLQLAGVHGRPSSEGGGTSPGGGRAARWARGPGGGRAGARLGCSGGAAPRAEGEPGAPRVPPLPAPPPLALPGPGRSATMWSCPGAESRRARRSRSFSHSPSSSLSAALPVMSDRGGGVSVNSLLAPTRGPRPPGPGPAARTFRPPAEAGPGRGP